MTVPMPMILTIALGLLLPRSVQSAYRPVKLDYVAYDPSLTSAQDAYATEGKFLAAFHKQNSNWPAKQGKTCEQACDENKECNTLVMCGRLATYASVGEQALRGDLSDCFLKKFDKRGELLFGTSPSVKYNGRCSVFVKDDLDTCGCAGNCGQALSDLVLYGLQILETVPQVAQAIADAGLTQLAGLSKDAAGEGVDASQATYMLAKGAPKEIKSSAADSAVAAKGRASATGQQAQKYATDLYNRVTNPSVPPVTNPLPTSVPNIQLPDPATFGRRLDSREDISPLESVEAVGGSHLPAGGAGQVTVLNHSRRELQSLSSAKNCLAAVAPPGSCVRATESYCLGLAYVPFPGVCKPKLDGVHCTVQESIPEQDTTCSVDCLHAAFSGFQWLSAVSPTPTPTPTPTPPPTSAVSITPSATCTLKIAIKGNSKFELAAGLALKPSLMGPQSWFRNGADKGSISNIARSLPQTGKISTLLHMEVTFQIDVSAGVTAKKTMEQSLKVPITTVLGHFEVSVAAMVDFEASASRDVTLSVTVPLTVKTCRPINKITAFSCGTQPKDHLDVTLGDPVKTRSDNSVPLLAKLELKGAVVSTWNKVVSVTGEFQSALELEWNTPSDPTGHGQCVGWNLAAKVGASFDLNNLVAFPSTICANTEVNKAIQAFRTVLDAATVEAKHTIVSGCLQLPGCGCFPPPPSPSPPPSPRITTTIGPTENPCFPSHAMIALADGRTARIDSLKAGDRLLAIKGDGSLGHDVVSRFSIADPTAKAAFISLTTDTGLSLELTEGHHLPVGPLRALKQARDVVVGDQIWVVDATQALVAQRIALVDVAMDVGLHNPLLKYGGQPIVNGVATSFNSAAIVAFDSMAVPLVESACAATGTCTRVRQAIAALVCAAKHLFAADPKCKKYIYIDGAVAVALTAADAAVGLAVLVTSAATAARVVRAAK